MEDMMKWLLDQPFVTHVECRAFNQYAKDAKQPEKKWKIEVTKFIDKWITIRVEAKTLVEAQELLVKEL